MPNISGTFDTYKEEKDSVRYFLKKMGCDMNTVLVEKYGGDNVSDRAMMDEADVIARFPDGKTLLFEVKQESTARFSRWGQLGFDMISQFQFKEGRTFDKRVHHPRDFERFMSCVDKERPGFKWGKVRYSGSDIWLFYVKDEAGQYVFCEGYDFAKMKENTIMAYLSYNCPFAVNSKNSRQMSHEDTWQSATFFVYPRQIEQYKITPESFLDLLNRD